MVSPTALNVGAITPLPEDWERALCVAAHPDDLEYGMASAVARWTAQRSRSPTCWRPGETLVLTACSRTRPARCGGKKSDWARPRSASRRCNFWITETVWSNTAYRCGGTTRRAPPSPTRWTSPAPGLRPRHPPLSGRTAGPAGRPHRAGQPARSLPPAAPGHTTRTVDLAAQRAHARAGGTTRRPGLTDSRTFHAWSRNHDQHPCRP